MSKAYKAKSRQEGGSASSPTEDALAAKLGKIGTRRRSIAPTILEDYARLFRRCPRVAGRLRLAASDAEVAATAHLILRSAVAALPNATDRLVAEAALAYGRFEGALVEQRKRDVDSTPKIGCNADAYRRRRERVLPEIARFLLKSEPPGRLPGPTLGATPETDGASAVLKSLRDHAAASADLQFHSLAAMFVAQFHYKIDRYSTYRQHDTEWIIWEEVARRLLLSAFIPYDSDVAWFHRAYDDVNPSEISDHMSRESWDTLRNLQASIRGLSPLGKREHELLDIYHEGYITYEEAEIASTLVEVWNPWYYREVIPNKARPNQVPDPDELSVNPLQPPTDIELLAARAGAVERLIGTHITYQKPVGTIARRRAHQLVASSYDVDEFAPVFDGRSLHNIVDTYFDDHTAALADSAIVWYDRNSINT